MEKRLMMLLSFLFIGIGFITAQTGKVTGVVLSEEDGLPVIGASVLIKGTSVGTLTDLDGNFVLTNVAPNATTLVVSYVGMKTQEVKIKPDVKIVLKDDVELLDEVIVVGYGTAKKVGTVVGSLSTVNSEKLTAKPTANVFDGLQGQVPGLQIFTSSGEPSAASSVQLRGIGSLTAGNEPLYILDGTPVSSAIMTTMNPNDFESVTVLKDASATSIYGSRAANGVIYLTSKKGKMGSGERAFVTLTSSYGISNLARRIGNPMNSKELLDYQLYHSIITPERYQNLLNTGVDTNWEKYMFEKDRPTHNTSVSIQGGSEKTRYYLSGSYYFKDGLTPNSEYRRYTFRSNIETAVNSWLRVGTNIGLSYDKSRTALFTYQGSNSLNGGILAVSMNEPYYNPYDKDGRRLDFIPGIGAYNPEYLADKNPRKSNMALINNSTFVQITPIQGLTIRSQFGLEAYDNRTTTKLLSSHPAAAGKGSAFESFGRGANLTITNTAEYKFDVNKIHNITVLIGQEGIRNQYQYFGSKTEGQNDDRLPELGSGITASFLGDDGFDKYKSAYLSFFGRVDYSLMDKYYADFSVRNDRSSKFGKDNRSSTFFSGGLMWNMKKEDWMKNISFITALQLKGSIGSTGNSSIGNYAHLGLVGTSNYDGIGWIINSPGNRKLGWETQILSNVGFDITFLDRFNLEFTYYHRKTKDMLMEVPLASTTGFSAYTENIGGMTNQGIELNLNLDLYSNKDWYVGLSANYAYNKNKITKLFGVQEWPMPSYNLIYKVGAPLQFYMPIYAGVDPEDGLQMWKIPGTNEVTKDTELADSGALNQATGKKRYAPHNGGFSLTAGWKGIAFIADFSWVLGKYMVNNDRYFSENPAAFEGYNQSKVVQNEWRQPGDQTNIPRYGEVMIFDTHLLENASFLRLKNIGLSYTLPKSLLAKTNFFKSVKFMINARNLLTATSYKGADPELNSNLSFGAYPNTKEYSFGTEITF